MPKTRKRERGCLLEEKHSFPGYLPIGRYNTQVTQQSAFFMNEAMGIHSHELRSSSAAFFPFLFFFCFLFPSGFCW